MKRLVTLLMVFISVLACKENTGKEVVEEETMSQEIAYATFGTQINDADAKTADEMLLLYKDLKIGDTISTKMKGTISEVCAMKGCWMILKMDDDNQVRVTFKDYGFFMPLDASGDVVINGIAYVSETSVDDLKHYAEDAGKSTEEIAAITQPKLTYSFEADGVLLKQ